MNGEDLYNGVTNIRDDLVEGAEKIVKRRPFRRRRWMVSAAAVLLAALTLTVILDPWGVPGGAYVIAAAKYPKQTQYHLWNETAWREDRSERLSNREIYQGTLGQFEKEVLGELLQGAGSENRVCSPDNLYMALAMLAEVTDGNSRREILKLLDCEDLETVRARANALWNVNYADDGTVTSLLANSIWLDKGVNFAKETVNGLAERYYASVYQGEMGSASFDRALRAWMNENTHGRLKEQIAKLSFQPRDLAGQEQESKMALVSTIYYREKWSTEFQKKETSPGVFHGPNGDQTVDFMHQTMRSGTYYWGEKFGAVAKRMKKNGTMWFILPDEGVSVDELLADEEALAFLSAKEEWENSKGLKIHFTVPKFDVSSDLALDDDLKKLGVSEVFDSSNADFSPLLAPGGEEDLQLFVSEVRQAARVMIDEEGCEAIAYVEILGAGSGAPPDDEIDFVLDRPFLFLITGVDDSILFAGVVNQP